MKAEAMTVKDVWGYMLGILNVCLWSVLCMAWSVYGFAVGNDTIFLIGLMGILVAILILMSWRITGLEKE